MSDLEVGKYYEDENGDRFQFLGGENWKYVGKAEKPSLTERFLENAYMQIDTGPKAITRAVEKLVAPESPHTQLNTQFSIEDKADYEAMPSFTQEEGILGKGLHGLAALGGNIGGQLLNPENIPAFNLTKPISAAAKLAGYNMAVDPVYQGLDLWTGSQQQYDPLRTVASGAVGGIFGGTIGGINKYIDNLSTKRIQQFKDQQRYDLLQTLPPKSDKDMLAEGLLDNLDKNRMASSLLENAAEKFAKERGLDVADDMPVPIATFRRRTDYGDRKLGKSPTVPERMGPETYNVSGRARWEPPSERQPGELTAQPRQTSELTGEEVITPETDVPGMTTKSIEDVAAEMRLERQETPPILRGEDDARWQRIIQQFREGKQAEIDEATGLLDTMAREGKKGTYEYETLESNIASMRLEKTEFDDSWRSAQFEALRRENSYGKTEHLVDNVLISWKKKVDSGSYNKWTFLADITYVDRKGLRNKNNLQSLWNALAERPRGKKYLEKPPIDATRLLKYVDEAFPRQPDGSQHPDNFFLTNYIKRHIQGLVGSGGDGMKKAKKYPDTGQGLVGYLRDSSKNRDSMMSRIVSSNELYPHVWVSKSVDKRIAHLVAGWQELLGLSGSKATSSGPRLTIHKDVSHDIVVLKSEDIPEHLHRLFPETLKKVEERSRSATNYGISNDLSLIVLRDDRVPIPYDIRDLFIKQLGKNAGPANIKFLDDLYSATHEFAHSYWRSLMEGLHKHMWGNEDALSALVQEFRQFRKSAVANKLTSSEYLQQAATHPRIVGTKGAEADALAAIFGYGPDNMGKEDFRIAFTEFITEQLARKLLNNRIGQFQPGKDTPLTSITDRVVAIYRLAMRYIKDLEGVDLPVNRMITEFVNNHVNKAQDIFEKTGETAYTRWALGAGNRVFGGKPSQRGFGSIDDMPVPHKTDNIYGTPEEALQAQKALKQPDLGVYSGQVLSRIFGAGTWIRMITERSPFMRHMISDLWRIEQKYKGTENNFLFGNISFDEFQLSGKLMNRVHNIKGIKEVFKPLPDVSILKLKELLADGAKNRVSHLDTFNANRANLTDDEKIAYIVMSHIFKRNYEMVNAQLILSGKPHLAFHEGWFPAYRGGQYLIILKDAQGQVLRVDSAYSKKDANRAIKFYETQNLTPIMVKRESSSGMFEEPPITAAIAYVRDVMKNPSLAAQLETLQNTIDVSKGKFGAHHEFRSDVRGFAGDRPWKSDSENARDFKEAVYKAIGDYTRFSMRTEMIRKWQPVVNNLLNDTELPNLARAANTYLNKHVGIVPEPWTVANRYTELFSRAVLDIPGIGAFIRRDQPAWNALTNFMNQIFYISALTTKPSFIAAQGLSPTLAWRAVDRLWAQGEGGLIGVDAYARSWWKMMDIDKDPDLMKALYWASQKTETLNPQFVADLNRLNFFGNMKGDVGRKLGNKAAVVIDVLTGQSPAEMADSFSRFQTFIMMHETLKKKGYSGQELWEKAAMETGASMIEYKTSQRPPWIGAMGNIGEAIAPITTFAHGMSGNIYGDVAHLLVHGKNNPKYMLPIVSTLIAGILTGGVYGTGFIAEYELLATAWNKLAELTGIDARMPSLIEWAMTDKRFENEFQRDALVYGVLSAASEEAVPGGVDVAASMRYQPFIQRFIGSTDAIKMMFPAVGFMTDIGTNMGKVFLSDLFDITGYGIPTSEAEYRTAQRAAIPGGYKGFYDMWEGSRKQFAPGDMGEAYDSITHTGKRGLGGVVKKEGEYIAPFYGTRSMDQVKSSDAIRKAEQKENTKQERKAKWVEIFVDAYTTGDEDKERVAREKLSELGATPDMLFTMIQRNTYRREFPQIETYGKGPLGKPSMGYGNTRKQLELERWMTEEE